MDTVSTWTLDALVSAGGETVETTLKVTIEDDPPEPDVGHKNYGMVVKSVFLLMNPKLLALLVTYCGEQITVGVNARPTPVKFKPTALIGSTVELFIDPGPLDAEIATYIAEVQLTLMEHTCLI